MKRTGLLVALLAACGGGGGSPPQVEQLVMLGTVPATVTTMDVTVANPLGADATVDEAEGSVGPFVPAIDALPAAVVAGGDLILPVVFHPPGPGIREGTIRLRFVAGGEEREVALLLRANVEKATLTLYTPTLAFPDTVFGKEKTLSVHVRNESALTSAAVTAVQGLPPEFSTSFTPRTLLPGEDLAIPVKYAPTTRGSHDFILRVKHDIGPSLEVHVTAGTASWPVEEIVDFGDVPLVNGRTDWLEVDVSPDAISLSIEAISTGVGLLNLEGPDGTIYLDEQQTGPFQWRSGYSSGVVAAMLPQDGSAAPQLVPGGGIYRFRFNHLFSPTAGGTVSVRAIIENRTGAVVEDGVLDLNIFLSPGLGVSDPATDPKLAAVVSRMDDIFAQVGLRMGEVSYYKLTNPAYDHLEYGGQPALWAESKAAVETRMNIFFVLTVQVGHPAVGLAAAAPGVKRNGTLASGVVVDYDFDNVVAIGQVAAHEVGHYLGLQHVDDIDNVMHYQYTGTALPTLTTGQGYVTLRHPLVAPDPLSGLSALAQKALPQVAYVQLPPGFCASCAASK